MPWLINDRNFDFEKLRFCYNLVPRDFKHIELLFNVFSIQGTVNITITYKPPPGAKKAGVTEGQIGKEVSATVGGKYNASI